MQTKQEAVKRGAAKNRCHFVKPNNMCKRSDQSLIFLVSTRGTRKARYLLAFFLDSH